MDGYRSRDNSYNYPTTTLDGCETLCNNAPDSRAVTDGGITTKCYYFSHSNSKCYIYYDWLGSISGGADNTKSYTICDGASLPSINTSEVTTDIKVAYQSGTANVNSLVID